MLTRRTALATIAALPFGPTQAQDGLIEKSIRFAGRNLTYLIRPAGVGGKRPMLLCFGGGDANRGIMEYYDQVYRPESVYTDHHVILPVGQRTTRFFQYNDKTAREMIAALIRAEPIEGRGLISGVSNGGRAAFRFAQAVPEAFRGFVVMPGAMGGRIVPAAWKDYAILLAYGTRDPRWQDETNRAFGFLQGKVGALDRVVLAGQGHVLTADYDVDPIYEHLKALEEKLGR